MTGVNGVKTALADGVLEQYGVDAVEIVKEIFGALGHKNGGRFFKFDGEQDPKTAALQKQINSIEAELAEVRGKMAGYLKELGVDV